MRLESISLYTSVVAGPVIVRLPEVLSNWMRDEVGRREEGGEEGEEGKEREEIMGEVGEEGKERGENMGGGRGEEGGDGRRWRWKASGRKWEKANGEKEGSDVSKICLHGSSGIQCNCTIGRG